MTEFHRATFENVPTTTVGLVWLASTEHGGLEAFYHSVTALNGELVVPEERRMAVTALRLLADDLERRSNAIEEEAGEI